MEFMKPGVKKTILYAKKLFSVIFLIYIMVASPCVLHAEADTSISDTSISDTSISNVSLPDESSYDSTVSGRQNSYGRYLAKYKDSSASAGEATAEEATSGEAAAGEPVSGGSASGKVSSREIIIPAASYSETDMQVEVLDNYNGSGGKSVRTSEEGYMEWKVNVEEEGLYNIGIKYYPTEGKSSAIERELRIDGEAPFFEAGNILLQRVWKNVGEIKRDNRGNDLSPRQAESPMWLETPLKDMLGYYSEPYEFYFAKGGHTIRFVSVKEPMVIEYLKLYNEEESPGYEAVGKEYENKGYTPAKDVFVKIQGEAASYKSDPTIYPTCDRSSPATEPYHTSKIRLNTIGGEMGPWNAPGQWVVWEFEAPEDGLYEIAIKERQNIVSGLYTSRKLYMDGKVPFKEMEGVAFNYNLNWKMKVLGDEEHDRPYLFYLTKGKHELKLEAVVGDMSQALRVVEESVLELNAAYRKIIMITSTTPDQFRDYQLDKAVPGVLKVFEKQGKVLSGLAESLIARTGRKGSSIVILETLSRQLFDMAKNPETIQTRLDNYIANVGALGTWIFDIKSQPLEIDYIVVASPGKELPGAEAQFFAKLLHEINAFIASFTEDYDMIGDVYENRKAITVWVQTGRDQAQILKELIDRTFTPKTGISVNLNLVQGQLLMATIAGKGPDVALQVGNSDPVNFATRKAVVNLLQFADYAEVEKRFRDSAIIPYRFNGGVYALPETQTFPMLFYRKDVLGELGLEVPDTWDDVFAMIAELQKHNMNFGMPTSLSAVGAGAAEMTSYGTFLYQRTGDFYMEDGLASRLDTDTAIDAFREWMSLFINYKLPVQMDFPTHFRRGDIPVGMADYSLYNTLLVFAPELRGLWDFAPVPGVRGDDGEVRRDIPGSGSACIMLKAARDKDVAWDFMKWWTDRETQISFGKGMENLLGPSARYPTANVEALNELPWPVKDYNNLMSQWKWVKGIPEVPGGYFTGRHLFNAFRKVYTTGDDERETLLDYVQIINDEIAAKRKEFGLD